MKKAVNRNRVNGFLDVDGRRIVNGQGEDVLLMGWGLGNWLLCEGYMWLSEGCDRFDRPRRIEAVIEELTGKAYAQKFWKTFREHYITEGDIQMMAEMGYNSVRIPLNARLFVAEGPGIQFVDEGFRLLDRVIDWCETHKLYAFIDLHGAPGGQTGANIDDCIDDVCRLFTDQDQFDKGVALWEKIAERYADRWIVGGYDLLNEPIRPVRFEGDTALEQYVPRLKEFYEKCIERIRIHDQKHLISLEGHHWATELDIFDHVYDPKMILHFHRYGCAPDEKAFAPFIEASERLNVPLWLGETGENTMEWFSAMMPLSASLDIGINLWPWKKMNCFNSPCSVNKPEEWDLIIGYAKGGAHPGYEKAQKILNEYLRNMLIENCSINEYISANVFRTSGCVIAGTAFEERPGKGVSYLPAAEHEAVIDYRANTGMQLHRRFPAQKRRFVFEGEWSQYALRLNAGEFACYSLYDVSVQSKLEISCYCPQPSIVEIHQDSVLLQRFHLSGTAHCQLLSGLQLSNADACLIRISVVEGTVDVAVLTTQAED